MGFVCFRKQEKIIQNFTGVWNVWQEVCVCDDDEATSSDTYRRETVLLQSLRKAIYAKGQLEGKSKMNLKFETVVLKRHIQFRFTKELTAMIGRSSATYVIRSSIERSQCKSISGVNMESFTSNRDRSTATLPLQHRQQPILHWE